MRDSDFLDYVYSYAENLNRGSLTQQQRDEIVSVFNRLEGDGYARARRAVRQVLGLNELTEELRKSANLDNSKRLLQDLQAAAQQWQAKKK